MDRVEFIKCRVKLDILVFGGCSASESPRLSRYALVWASSSDAILRWVVNGGGLKVSAGKTISEAVDNDFSVGLRESGGL